VTDGLDPRLVADIVDLLRRNGVEPPTDLTLLGRALGTLSGTLTLMAPEFSFTEEAEAIARADLADATDWAEEARREVLRTAPALRALPELSEAIARQLRAGTLAVRVDPWPAGRPSWPGRGSTGPCSRPSRAPAWSPRPSCSSAPA
jgi:ubiquinone biosynthesis protein